MHKENSNSLTFDLSTTVSHGYFPSCLNSLPFGTAENPLSRDIYPPMVSTIWFSIHLCNGIFSLWLVCLSSCCPLSPLISSSPGPWALLSRLSLFLAIHLLLCQQVISDQFQTDMSFLSLHLVTYRHQQAVSLSYCVNFSMVRATSITERTTSPELKTLTHFLHFPLLCLIQPISPWVLLICQRFLPLYLSSHSLNLGCRHF